MLSHLVIALAALSTVMGQVPSWHLDSLYTLAIERLDPIVSPNGVSGHMHQILGGSGFGAAYNYEASQKASCTTSAITVDKSNYWMPKLYWINNNGSSFTPLSAFTRFYYHLGRNSPSEPVSPFPEGLRMLTGDPNSKVGGPGYFTCHVNSDLSTGDINSNNFNFGRDCPYGMRVDINFPCCWDGVNLYKSDQSHMAYPQASSNAGTCPWSHPIRVPQIMLEYTFYTSSWAPGVPLAGNLAWANGDTTGFGAHADFTNGWDTQILAQALNDTQCAGGGDLAIQQCNVFAPYYNPSAASKCTPDLGQMNEVGENNADGVPIPTLAGCNPLWGNTPVKPTNCGSPTTPNVTPFQGTNGPIIASPAAVPTLPTTPGWHDLGCVQNSAAVFNSASTLYYDTNLTATACQANCLLNGLPYAFVGTNINRWECRCGANISMDAGWFPGQCSTPCPGDASQLCGGNNVHEVYYAPPGTQAPPASSSGNAPDVSFNDGLAGYVGCYSTVASTNSNMITNAISSFTANTMTNEYCVQTCANQNATWAATISSNTCKCGMDLSRGLGYYVNDAQCTAQCVGNNQESCGSWTQQYSVFNVSASGIKAKEQPKYPPGRKGCFYNGWGTNGLNGYSWYGNSVTVEQCQYGCAALNYTLAGLTSGNRCRCGNTWQGANQYPDSQCSMTCSGNNNEFCGAQFNSDLYSVAPLVPTVEAAVATKPVGWKGCYKDPSSGSAFSFSRYDNLNNPQRCRATCTGLGYSWMGLEVGNYCKCGNTDPTLSNQAVPFNAMCNVQCPGNANQTCGGWGNFEVVQLTGLPTTTAASPSSTSSAPTVSGNAAGGVSPSPSASAGKWTASGSGSTGCFADVSTMNGFQISSSYMTVDMCLYFCQAQGSAFAGLSQGNSCQCSSVSPTIHVGQDYCLTPCVSNANQTCGASSNVQVWPVSAASNFVNPYSVAAADSNGYMGCWSDASSRMLSAFTYNSNSLTQETCRDNCAAQGYTFSGTEASTQCFCTSKFNTGTQFFRRADSECTSSCSGNNKETCGGNWRLSVFAHGQGSASQASASPSPGASKTGSASVGTPTNPTAGASSAGYQGCFSVGTTISNASFSLQGYNGMTPQFCQRTCMSQGLPVSAVQGGNNCYCASSSTLGNAFPSSYCSTPCAGDNSQMCGNDYLVSVYAASPAAPGFPQDYVGCFGDTSSRVLPNFQTSSNQLTAAACRAVCTTKGYSVYGTENGNQCFCGTSIPNTVQYDNQCNAGCYGNGTQACGGPWKLSLYKVGFSSLPNAVVVLPNSAKSSTSSAIPSSSIKVTPTAVSSSAAKSSSSAAASSSSSAKVVSSVVASSSSSSSSSSTVKAPASATVVSSASSSTVTQAAPASTKTVTSSTTTSTSSAWTSGTASNSTSTGSFTKGSFAASTNGTTTTAAASSTTVTTSSSSSSTTTSSTTTTASSATPSNYLGCFSDPASSFSNSMTASQLTNTNCQAWCSSNGKAYAATQNGQTCACSEYAPNQSVNDSQCSTACSGSSTTQCGGSSTWSVYSVDESCSAPSKRALDVAQLEIRKVVRTSRKAQKARQDQV